MAASEAFDNLLTTTIVGDTVDEPIVRIKPDALRLLFGQVAFKGISVENGTLDQLYRALIQTFITRLPQMVPARMRLALEKDSRSLAARICLAGITAVTQSPGQENELLSTQALSTLELPLRSSPVDTKPSSASLGIPNLAIHPTSDSSVWLPPSPSPSSRSHVSNVAPGSSISATGANLQSHIDIIKNIRHVQPRIRYHAVRVRHTLTLTLEARRRSVRVLLDSRARRSRSQGRSQCHRPSCSERTPQITETSGETSTTPKSSKGRSLRTGSLSSRVRHPCGQLQQRPRRGIRRRNRSRSIRSGSCLPYGPSPARSHSTSHSPVRCG